MPPCCPLLPQSASAATWAGALAANAARRDFTANGLLYDPFSRCLLDYVGGVADVGQRLLRTIAEPGASFREDPARILRGIRLAARAGGAGERGRGEWGSGSGEREQEREREREP